MPSPATLRTVANVVIAQKNFAKVEPSLALQQQVHAETMYDKVRKFSCKPEFLNVKMTADASDYIPDLSATS